MADQGWIALVTASTALRREVPRACGGKLAVIRIDPVNVLNIMKRLPAALALATTIAIAGCGAAGSSSSGSSSGSSAGTTSGTGTGTGTTCAQQFTAWQNGPAEAVAEKIVPSLNQVQSSAKTEDIPELNAALKAVGTIAQQLQAYPMPACADPAGYWTQMLGYLKAAGDNAGSSSGLAGLLTAIAPLEKVPGVEASLQAEPAKNAGFHGKVLGG